MDPKDLSRAAIARVLIADEPSGHGFHVHHGLVVTCAHVVAPDFPAVAQSTDGDGTAAAIALQFPAIERVGTATALLQRISWSSFLSSRDDTAILSTRIAPGILPETRLSPTFASATVEVIAFVNDRDSVTVRGNLVGTHLGGWLQFNVDEDSPLLQRGFSGAPVFDADGTVVGMVATVIEDSARFGQVVPAEVIAKLVNAELAVTAPPRSSLRPEFQHPQAGWRGMTSRNDQPHRGAFGGNALRAQRKLSAVVTQNIGVFSVRATVSCTAPGQEVREAVAFYLHPGVQGQRPLRTVKPRGGVAAITFRAPWPFTIGAVVGDDGTALELDLAKVRVRPEGFA